MRPEPTIYYETPFELNDGRILILQTDRAFPMEDGLIIYDAKIMSREEHLQSEER